MVWSLFPLSVFAALSHLSQGERQGRQKRQAVSFPTAAGEFEGVKTRLNEINRCVKKVSNFLDKLKGEYLP